MSVSPDDMSFLDRLAGVLSPGPDSLDSKLQPFGGAANLGAALLANSGYSTTPRNFGQVLGASVLQGQQLASQRQNDQLRNQYLQAQIEAMRAKPVGATPASVAEYEYAKSQGFKGSFEEWQTKARAQNDPAEVAAYKYFASLTPEQKQEFLKLKRNVGSDYAIETINGVPTVVYKPAAGGPMVAGGTPLMTPLTSLQQEVSATGQLAGAKAQSTAVGTATGELQGGIIKKATNANSVLGMLDLADPLVDAATGSLAGAGADKLAAAFGKVPKGAEAIAQLKVLQAGLMLNMPRMEGPQSDRDVQLYREGAASLGEPTVPRDIKKAAIRTIRAIQEKYKEAGAQMPQILPNGSQGATDADQANINSLLDKYAPRR